MISYVQYLYIYKLSNIFLHFFFDWLKINLQSIICVYFIRLCFDVCIFSTSGSVPWAVGPVHISGPGPDPDPAGPTDCYFELQLISGHWKHTIVIIMNNIVPWNYKISDLFILNGN